MRQEAAASSSKVQQRASKGKGSSSKASVKGSSSKVQQRAVCKGEGEAVRFSSVRQEQSSRQQQRIDSGDDDDIMMKMVCVAGPPAHLPLGPGSHSPAWVDKTTMDDDAA